MHVEVDAEVAVRVEGPAALGAEEASRLVGVLGALVLQELRGPGEGGGAMHAGMQRRAGGGPALVFLLLLRVAVLVTEQLGTGGEGALAGQAGEGGRSLVRGGVWAGQGGARQAGGEGAVVVVEMVMGVGL